MLNYKYSDSLGTNCNQRDFQDFLEENLPDNLQFELERAVKDGKVDKEYATYLLNDPIRGADWIRDNLGIYIL